MRKLLMLLVGCGLLGVAARVEAGLTIGITNDHYSSEERDALVSTLTGMGHSVVPKGTGDFSGLDVYLSFPGGKYYDGPSQGDVANGVNYVQIGDWGRSVIPNGWQGIGFYGMATVSVHVDMAHPLTAGLPSDWVAKGFWSYGYSEQYLGFTTSGNQPSLASDSSRSQSGILAAEEIGSGRAVFIGWNVYGPLASSNDLQVLENALSWASNRTAAVPEPGAVILFGLGMSLIGGEAVRRRAVRAKSPS